MNVFGRPSLPFAPVAVVPLPFTPLPCALAAEEDDDDDDDESAAPFGAIWGLEKRDRVARVLDETELDAMAGLVW